jgi:hypothetical protein
VSQGIEIEVMGHKGKITRLLPLVRPFPRIFDEEKDLISAWVEFDPPVDGTMGIYVNIPAKDYTREELIQAIVKAVQAAFLADRERKDERASREVREKGLGDLVERVKKAAGLV